MLPSIWRCVSVVLSWSSLISASSDEELVKKSPSVRVKNGSYTGVYSPQYDQDFFLGVPFALPPVGDLRFSTPQSLNSSWKTARPVSSYSASCIGYGPDNDPYPSHSEDCLYLNVVRPSGYEHRKLPVAFWIHGGGLLEGSAIDQRYNLSFIVEQSVKIGKPILAVSINYRVNMWGFITGSDVLKSGNTNLGFRDQRLALHWVQENIAAFGGDPSKVTIWGESAGALSVGMHITAYGGRNDHLFHRAIMESGNPINYGTFYTDDTAFTNATESLGCDSAADKLQCLREVPFDKLNTWINTTVSSLRWSPVIDRDFIQRKTSLQLAKGEFVHIPIIDGANSDEGTAFGPSPIDSEQDFINALETSLASHPIPASAVSSVLSAYPSTITHGAVPTGLPVNDSTPFGANYRRSAAYYGDAVMIAHRRLTCQTWTKFGLPAYCYRFNTIPNPLPSFVGTTHFQEVAFVFNNKNGDGYGAPEARPFYGKPQSYKDLSDQMSEAWIRFVHDGKPGKFWPTYGKGVGKNYVFDADVTGLGYVEKDDWRWEGIKLINSWNSDIYER